MVLCIFICNQILCIIFTCRIFFSDWWWPSYSGVCIHISPDDILDKVTDMLGSAASGFPVPFGGDKDTAGFDVGGVDCNRVSSDARVSVALNEAAALILMSIDHGIETVVCGGDGGGVIVTDCKAVHDVTDQLRTPKTNKFTSSIPKTGNRYVNNFGCFL